MSTIGTTLFSKIEINGQEVDIATLDANDGIYALPAGYTTANVKFTMIDNTSIPRGVFEENSYITAMTLPDAMTYIASYSFHGVNNINTTDRNAILAINPYAFDAEPTPSYIDPDLHYVGGTGNYDLYTHMETIPGLQNSYNVSPITYTSSDTAVATVNPDGIINYLAVGTTTITASFAGDTTYEADSTSFSLTVADSTPVADPDFYFYSNNYEITSGTGMGMNLYNNTQIDPMTYPIQWSSSSADISIDQSGYVSSSMVGATGTITATISDGTNTHTATCTVSVVASRQSATGGWYENSSQVFIFELVEGSIDAHTLTFEATPNDSWTFSYMSLPTGITLDSSTGEITVQSGALATAGEYYIHANRMEDASYYSGMTTFTIKIFPTGTDLNFHFDQQSVNLDNQAMTTKTPMLINSTGIDTMQHPIQYVSGDTNVATVDAYGMISFAGAGNTTVTATLSDGNETHTATITVNCTAYYTAAMHYTDGQNDLAIGYFDENPMEHGYDNNISIVVELTGPEITNSGDIHPYLNFDSTYSATQYGSLTLNTSGMSVNYQGGDNIITIPLQTFWDGSATGTDRYIFSFQYAGVSYIQYEGIKVYFSQVS